LETSPGLPDGIFSNQNSQFRKTLECIAKKDIVKFYGPLVYFTAISNFLWPFGIFCGHFWYVCFSSFGMSHHEKSGNPELLA
jgi:hypothetical protein